MGWDVDRAPANIGGAGGFGRDVDQGLVYEFVCVPHLFGEGEGMVGTLQVGT